MIGAALDSSRRLLAALLAALVLVPPARAATPAGVVRGTVTLSKKTLFGGVALSADASGVIVYVTGYTEPPPDGVVELAQENERFSRRVLPIVAGQTVSFPNRDRFYHNVFSVSPVHSFDLGQYKSTDTARTQRFTSPGLVPVYCNIHPDMIAYVLVLENAAFAVTDARGAFQLRGVRAGRVTVNAWLPGARRVSRELVVDAGREATVDLEVAQTETVPPHARKDGTPYPPPGLPYEYE
jgi:plastocyanin